MKKNPQIAVGLLQIGLGLVILNSDPVNPNGSQTPRQIAQTTKFIGALGGMAITLGGISIFNAKD